MNENESQNVENVNESPVVDNEKKKLPFIFRFLRGIFIVILSLIIILVGVMIFCAVDKKQPVSVIPSNFSVYLKTDSAFHTLNPMLDLHAADVFLAAPDLKSIRPLFMELRASSLRNSILFQKLASRSVDAALYDGYSKDGVQNFLAVVDLGFMSFVTRPLPFIFPKIQANLKNILDENNIEAQFVEDDVFSYFEVKSDGNLFFVTPLKNLLVISDSKEILMMSVLASNEISYTENQIKILSQKSDELRIVVNAKKIVNSFMGDDSVFENIANLFPNDELSTISLKISDSDIFLDVKIPVSVNSENPTSLEKLISKKSTVPVSLSKMTDIVQYYTLINAGTLEELQKAIFPILPVKDANSLWSKANVACKLAFSMDLNDMLFSWTGRELAVLGIENQNDPVFVMQVADEKKRQIVFDKLVSSIFISEDNSLILGGVRLPRLQLPSFLNGLLSVFGVEIPKPYFMVLDGFIYFSESPEALSAVYSNSDSGKSLMKTEGWRSVSSELKNDATISLFYDLERSVPFFLRSNASLSQVLELYTMGRFDVKIKDGEINISLQSNARKSGNLRIVPGFPIQAGRNANVSSFVAQNVKNPSAVFWTEGVDISMLDIAALNVKKIENIGRAEIVASSEKIKNAALWCVTADGYVSLYDKNLELLPNFPIVISDKTVRGIVSCDEGVLVPLENGSIVLVDSSGATSVIQMPEISIKSSPTVLRNIVAVYDKSFLGSIYLIDLKKLSCINPDTPIVVDEIGFGSPAMIQAGRKILTAFVSQSGALSIWEDLNDIPIVSKDLEGVFEGNIVASENYFYVISTDAVLYQISPDGDILSVKIPRATAKNAYLSVQNIAGKTRVFVNADSNIIYGFNEKLELLSGYPLAGSGKPVFSDVNGDRIPEILSMSLDKKILSWKLR